VAKSADTEAESVPTVGFEKPTEIESKGFRVQIYDIGGAARIRDLWKSYYHEVHGVIFVVDAAAPDRVNESKLELDKLLEDPMIVGKPMLMWVVTVGSSSTDSPTSRISLAHSTSPRSSSACSSTTSRCRATRSSSALPSPRSVGPLAVMPQVLGRVDDRVLQGLDWLTSAITSDLHNLQARLHKERSQFEENERRRKEDWKVLAQQEKEAREKGAVASEVPKCVRCKERDAVKRSQAAGW
jgi:ADP-ribosylation factor-like protein 13B